MKAIMKIVRLGVVVALLALIAGSGHAVAQQYGQTLKQQLVGTWTLVSFYYIRPDGSKLEPWGSNPKGIHIFTTNGLFAVQILRSDLPKFASNDRLKGTAEENKAVVQGSNAYFGTYSVNSDGTISERIEGSSFPNWIGTNQKREVVIKDDQMELVNPTGSVSGTTAHISFKRVP